MNRDDLCFTSAVELARMIRERQISPVELMAAVLARIDDVNPKLNAFTKLLPEQAMDGARAAEHAVMKGEPLGPLHGLPLSIKDMVLTKGVTTMMGSRIFEHRVPDVDVPMVERLRAAGAVFFGKTTTPEFGWKAVTDSPVSGITRNPWDTSVTPGGSSGGASAQIAAGMGTLATGGDGAGSIRVPASFTGLFGIKPQYGRIPFAPQGGGDMLAHLGPLTRTVADAALFLSATAGPDDRDRFSLEAPPADYLGELGRGIEGLRIAWSPTLGYVDNLDPQVRAVTEEAVKAFESLGAHVDVVEDPGFGDPKPIIDTYWCVNFAIVLEHYLDAWSGKIDPALEACAREGMAMGPLDFARAQVERHAYYYRVLPFFDRYDLLMTPSVATLPFTAGALYPEGYAEHPWDWIRWAPYSFPFNLTHLPAASVPAGFSREGLPIGLQLVGRRFAETTVLRAAAAFEEARPWADRRPPI
ncbi:MAG: amidase [Planctomycetes bacterium]|nr:amidase [Planctomycetota bacterium]